MFHMGSRASKTPVLALAAGLGLFVATLAPSARADDSGIPSAVAMPGAEVRQVLFANGVQVYRCVAATEGGARHWQLAGPEAELFSDAGHATPVGRHFAGPTWEAQDGSRLTGKVRTSVPAPDPASIPWLLVDVRGSGPNGLLSGITAIQRVFTAGGKPPAASCTDGTPDLRVPYTAQYRLLAPAR